MQILRTITFAAVAAIQVLQPSSRTGPVLVRAVFDGDTIDVASVGHVRLLGIDAPEIGHGFDTPAPFGREARERLAGLVLRRYVRLEYEGPRDDMYSRRLAYLVLDDGTIVNEILVREGLARISARLPLSRLDELRQAEMEAKTYRRGMWGDMPQGSETTYTRPSPKTTAKARPKARKVGKSSPKPRVHKASQPRARKKGPGSL
jgi:micrococcal nuclease